MFSVVVHFFDSDDDTFFVDVFHFFVSAASFSEAYERALRYIDLECSDFVTRIVSISKVN